MAIYVSWEDGPSFLRLLKVDFKVHVDIWSSWSWKHDAFLEALRLGSLQKICCIQRFSQLEASKISLVINNHCIKMDWLQQYCSLHSWDSALLVVVCVIWSLPLLCDCLNLVVENLMGNAGCHDRINAGSSEQWCRSCGGFACTTSGYWSNKLGNAVKKWIVICWLPLHPYLLHHHTDTSHIIRF